MFFSRCKHIKHKSLSHKTIIERLSDQQVLFFLTIFDLKSLKKLKDTGLRRSEERGRHFCAHFSELLWIPLNDWRSENKYFKVGHVVWYYIKSATQALGSLECGGLSVKQPCVPKSGPLQIMFHPVNAGGLWSAQQDKCRCLWTKRTYCFSCSSFYSKVLSWISLPWGQ